jgi:hypothetical protein
MLDGAVSTRGFSTKLRTTNAGLLILGFDLVDGWIQF